MMDADVMTMAINPTGEVLTVDHFLSTLQRLPDDLVRDIAKRPLTMSHQHTCICGWALRIEHARKHDEDASDVYLGQTVEVGTSVPVVMAARFGGSGQEWKTLFMGVAHMPFAALALEAWNRRVSDAMLNAVRLNADEIALPAHPCVLTTV